MLFNSIEFALFLPIVFLLYWFLLQRKLQLQNFFIVVASYIFYGWWDWRFLVLIGFTTLCSWLSGVLLVKVRNSNTNIDNVTVRNKARTIAIINIVLNLAVLAFFKYYNFFVESFVDAFRLFGKELNIHTLKIILPVGISFYTFQALSYTIDVYKRKLEPTKDITSFFAYVSFFPQLVAGPIERATNLLPQFYKKRTFEYGKAVDGCKQILWGLFKKMVIADNCAVYVNDIFSNYHDFSGHILIIGAILFAIQIYGDFSGYSDIAIGTARLFGFDLMRNFNYPYFARDIAEFWRRWHISLSTWFRDYVYIPLGGSRCSKPMVIRNTLIIYLLSGFWHGANWTFIIWGLYHAILFLPLILFGKNRKYTNTVAETKYLPNLKEVFQMGVTFLLVVIGWIFFRADNLEMAINYFCRILNFNLQNKPIFTEMSFALPLIINICILFTFEWVARNQQFALANIGLKWKRTFRWMLYILIILIVFLFGNYTNTQEFIYFQF